MYIHLSILYINRSIKCFTAPTQWFQVFYMCTFQRCSARFKDVVHVPEMLCTFPSTCARFTEVVHVSQKLCTFYKPPNNVRVELYTHRAHSNQQKHWGDQTRSPDKSIFCIHIYIYVYTSITYIHLCYMIHIYIYIYTSILYIYIQLYYVYIYIYIHNIYIYIHIIYINV